MEGHSMNKKGQECGVDGVVLEAIRIDQVEVRDKHLITSYKIVTAS